MDTIVGTHRARILPVLASIGAVLLFAAIFSSPAAAQDPSDEEITRAVQRELRAGEAGPYDSIEVETRDGIVVLQGSVDNLLVRDVAAEIAESEPGALGVVNNLQVDAPEREDREVLDDVREALRGDPATEAYQVTPVVEDARLTLSGTVDSQAEKELVDRVVRQVEGIREVDNRITVRPSPETRTDVDIEQEVKSRLRWDALVDDSLIAVSVKGGVVALAGTVLTAAQKRRAIVNAQVEGVEEVRADDLAVARPAGLEKTRKRFSEPNDDEVRQAVERAFRYHARVKRYPVDVEVHDGVVTLRGEVGNLAAKRAAASAAESIRGVVRVANLVEVGPIQPMAPAEVADNVRRALAMDPFVEEESISVHVAHRTVRLSGTVGSELERERAESTASRARGVVEVDNQLKVERTS